MDGIYIWCKCNLEISAVKIKTGRKTVKKNRLFLIFSHKLTEDQQNDARETFGVDEFVSLPKSLQQLWSNIAPEEENIYKYLSPLWEYMAKQINSSDVVLIQGDFGATYLAIKLAKELEALPIYATTKRVVKEEIENNEVIKTSIFKHVRYRIYE